MRRSSKSQNSPAQIAWSYRCQHVILFLCISGVTLMIVTFLLNLYEENHEESFWMQVLQYVLLFLYLVLATVGFFLGFLAVFWEDSRDIRLAIRFVLLAALLYVILTVLSLIPNKFCRRIACPGGRCSDHHWLLGGRWRHLYEDNAALLDSELYIHIHESQTAQEHLVTESSTRMRNETIVLSNTSIGVLEDLVPVFVDPKFLREAEDDTETEQKEEERVLLKDDVHDRRKKDVLFVILSVLHIVFIIGYYGFSLHVLNKYRKYVLEYEEDAS